jgi:hypothetical protein
MGERINVYTFLVGTSEGKRSLGESRHKCADKNTMYLTVTGSYGMDWVRPSLDRNEL